MDSTFSIWVVFSNSCNCRLCLFSGPRCFERYKKYQELWGISLEVAVLSVKFLHLVRFLAIWSKTTYSSGLVWLSLLLISISKCCSQPTIYQLQMQWGWWPIYLTGVSLVSGYTDDLTLSKNTHKHIYTCAQTSSYADVSFNVSDIFIADIFAVSMWHKYTYLWLHEHQEIQGVWWCEIQYLLPLQLLLPSSHFAMAELWMQVKKIEWLLLFFLILFSYHIITLWKLGNDGVEGGYCWREREKKKKTRTSISLGQSSWTKENMARIHHHA